MTQQQPMVPTGNGPATASIVLGIVGTGLGLIPFFFFVSPILGVLAITFGVGGRQRHRRGETLRGKGAATAGIVLGLIAIGLGVVGFIVLDEAFSNL